jgi:hypothetical protein
VISCSLVRAHHVPWRIPDHRVEAGASPSVSAGIEEDFWKLELPVKKPVRACGGLCRAEQFVDFCLWQRAAAGEDCVRKRCIEPLARVQLRRKPTSTPEISHSFPLGQRRMAAGQLRQSPFFRAHLFRRVVRL